MNAIYSIRKNPALLPSASRNLTNRQEERIAVAVNAASKGGPSSSAAAAASASASSGGNPSITTSATTAPTAANTPASSVTAAMGPGSPPHDTLDGSENGSGVGSRRDKGGIGRVLGRRGVGGRQQGGRGKELDRGGADVAWLQEVEGVEKIAQVFTLYTARWTRVQYVRVCISMFWTTVGGNIFIYI